MVVPDRPFFFRSPIWLTSLIPVLKWILMRSQEFLVLVSRSLLQNTPTVDLLSSNIQCLFNSFLSWLKAHSYQSPYFSSVDLTVAVTWSVGYPPPLNLFLLLEGSVLGIVAHIVAPITLDFSCLYHLFYLPVQTLLCYLKKYLPTFVGPLRYAAEHRCL